MGKFMDGPQQPNLAQLLLAGRPAVTETIQRSDLTQRGIFMRQAATVAWLQFWSYVFALIWVLLYPLAIYLLVAHLFFFPSETWLFWLFILICVAIVLMLLFAMASWEPRKLLIERLKGEISQDDVKESLAIVRRMIEDQAAQPKPSDPGPVLVPVTTPVKGEPVAPPSLHWRVLKARALYAFVQDAQSHGLARNKRTCSFDAWGGFTADLARVGWIAKNGTAYDWVMPADKILATLYPYCQFDGNDTWQPVEREGLD